MKFKILLLPVLLIILIVLIIFRPGKNESGTDEKAVEKSFKSREEIKVSLPLEIDSILFSYGIQKEWVKNSAPVNSTAWFSKEIQLSYDIYAGAVASDIDKYILRYNLYLESKEDFNPNLQYPVNLYAQIKDFNVQPEISVGSLNFVYKDFLKRLSGDICIVLNNLESIENEKAKEIINNQSYFSFVMPNSFEAIDLQALMIDLKSNYINCFELGEADNYQADFRDQQNDNAGNRRNTRDNIQKMNQICNEYDKEKGLVLLNPKKLYETQQIIINGLTKCRGNVYTDTVLIPVDLRGEPVTNKIQFEKIIKEKTSDGLIKKVILLSIRGEDYPFLLEAVSGMEKKGYRFFYFLEFINKVFPVK
jgi:hypothetical protein